MQDNKQMLELLINTYSAKMKVKLQSIEIITGKENSNIDVKIAKALKDWVNTPS